MLTLGVVVIVAVIAGFVVVANLTGGSAAADGDRLVRADSHRLNESADGPTVVEFLDFECEACGAAYPGVEKLRAEYGDRITYVVRYFPIASHPNAYHAAHAAEAAARQGKFAQMYVKLFDNQKVWGHHEQSQAQVFAGYAAELGLDVDRFTADVDSAEVRARVEADSADGEALGVTGTPTFFVDGERFDGRASYAGLKTAIDAALAG